MADDGDVGGSVGGFAGGLGARMREGDDGAAVLDFEVRDEHLNPAGTLHGGVLATLVDTAMGQAVRTTTGEGEVPATSQLTVTYLRPGKPGPLEVRGRVRTRGEHLTICEADVEQEGRALAHAVATFAVLQH
ncbi:PaaI family thioesterase [Geodermatophilus nigrescens]